MILRVRMSLEWRLIAIRAIGACRGGVYRPRAMVTGPMGRVWIASVPDYGLWGGPLSWFDPGTEQVGLTAMFPGRRVAGRWHGWFARIARGGDDD